MTSTEIYSEDELVAPEWLNREFFKTVLQNCEKVDDVEINNFELTPGTLKGDHYASVMFRAKVEYNLAGVQNVKSMIIKTMPEMEGDKKDFLGDTRIFETEIGIYTKILPKFESILRSVGDDTTFGPKCLHWGLNPKQFIILEDLVPLGYSILRERDVNMEEVKEVFRKLALFHGISYFLLEKEPELFDTFRYCVMNQPKMCQNDFMTDSIPLVIEMLDEVPSLNQYKPFFETLQKDMMENCRKTCDEYRENPQKDGIYVLCHGDFHFKNMMFKNHTNQRNLENALFLDFQMSFVGPIVVDLSNAFYMMLSREQRFKRFDELLHLYYSHFKSILSKVGFGGTLPELSDIRALFLKHKHLEFFIFAMCLPVRYVWLDKSFCLEKAMGSRDFRKSLYSNPAFLEEVHHLLSQYSEEGFFKVS
ncbi:uncharacterized protein LOC119678988 [Teleopsis dalmanni]|uniref:uncharacterized protein LOC119678988 n=1 Tax=Teleopsis dalmanni TaxID=139649 RepID=UPI0018CD6A59|nr:uncharacterized protein LOC119678988 [Teleopsis dalmanni]